MKEILLLHSTLCWAAQNCFDTFPFLFLKMRNRDTHCAAVSRNIRLKAGIYYLNNADGPPSMKGV